MHRSFRFLALSAVLLQGAAADPVALRIDPAGFDAPKADIRAVCRSAGETLWRHMDEMEPVKVLVSRGKHGPIAIYGTNERGETRVRLDTSQTYWAQYAYQFAHEICHVLCRYEDDYKGNLWFEETLCETASLFCLRRMSVTWRKNAPYPNWQSYAPSLRDYTDDIIRKRQDHLEILRTGLPAYYRRHALHLRDHPTDRDRNGAMALALLTLLERDPSQWNAIRWLNSTPSPEGETFAAYLAKWHEAVPGKHRPFVTEVAGLFGIPLPD